MAILKYEDIRGSGTADAKVTAVIDEKSAGSVCVTSKTTGAVDIAVDPDQAAVLEGAGKHVVGIHAAGQGDRPVQFFVKVKCSVVAPPTDPTCALRLSTQLGKAELVEGESTSIQVELENVLEKGIPMTVVIVGIPGGLEARVKKLDELKNGGQIASYELFGKDVVFYFREMSPREKKVMTFDVAAAVPGEYRGPASRAYLYYTDEKKFWVPGLAVTIKAT